MASDRAIEERTVEIGKDIFASVAEAQPRALSRAWFDDKAMTRTMRDERLKVQLFRFVDALPGLHDGRQINQHVAEYLDPVAELLPGPARFALKRVNGHGPIAWFTPAIARFAARSLARKFIAGSDLGETVRSIRRLRDKNLAFTIDLLGEAILSEREAEQYQAAYFELIDGLADAASSWREIAQIDRAPFGPLPPVNISVKLTALSSRFEPADPEASSRAVRERLRPILRRAKERKVFVNVDMESFAVKDLTLKIFKDVLEESEFRSWGDVGIAIQAYLKSCGDDLAGLASWAQKRGTPAWVRLVKGAYWDYEQVVAAQNGWPVPVFSQKSESDANFEAQSDFLIERRDVLRPALGSHNVRSIAHALARCHELGLPPGTVEFQMLFGMADPLKAAIARRGERVRIYTPYGKLLPGMAYLVRRLLENTSNEGFVRAGFLEHASQERLLMDPAQTPKKNGVERTARGFVNEAPVDFSRETSRQTMLQALADVRAKLPIAVPLVIDGKQISQGKQTTSVNPAATAQIVGTIVNAGPEQARQAVAAAARAFPQWRDTSPQIRADALDRVAGILARRKHELTALIVLEVGKGWREADGDVAEAIDFCRFYAAEMRRMAAPRRRDVPGELNEYFYEPRGVTVVIAPWNFPLAILCGMAAAAVVTGNTVIMKPAEQSPAIAYRLMEAFSEAGLPPGVMNFCPGIGEEIGPLLVSHPDVSLIAFTGSRQVGLAINRSAAEVAKEASEVKRVITEMGGKNAIIVDDDADLDEAVHGVMWSAFSYQGQKCSACSRAIVLPGIYRNFLERLIDATRSLTIGPPELPSNALGPVIDGEARDRIVAAIARGKSEARLAYAGDAGEQAKSGYFVAPHIFADVPEASTIAQEEIFGPVLAVIPAKDLSDALRIANGTRYALTGGCYTRSPTAIERMRREFRVGNLYINRKITGALVDRQPFGGFKLSGIGSKAGGPDYLLQFVVPRAVTENTLRHGFAPPDATADSTTSAPL